MWIYGLLREIRRYTVDGTFRPFSERRGPSVAVVVERLDETADQAEARLHKPLADRTEEYWGEDPALKEAAEGLFNIYTVPIPPKPPADRNGRENLRYLLQLLRPPKSKGEEISPQGDGSGDLERREAPQSSRKH